MRYLIFALLLAGCGRDNANNYNCNPSLLNEIDHKAKECAGDSRVLNYADCLRNLKMAFCKYGE